MSSKLCAAWRYAVPALIGLLGAACSSETPSFTEDRHIVKMNLTVDEMPADGTAADGTSADATAAGTEPALPPPDQDVINDVFETLDNPDATTADGTSTTAPGEEPALPPADGTSSDGSSTSGT